MTEGRAGVLRRRLAAPSFFVGYFAWVAGDGDLVLARVSRIGPFAVDIVASLTMLLAAVVGVWLVRRARVPVVSSWIVSVVLGPALALAAVAAGSGIATRAAHAEIEAALAERCHVRGCEIVEDDQYFHWRQYFVKGPDRFSALCRSYRRFPWGPWVVLFPSAGEGACTPP